MAEFMQEQKRLGLRRASLYLINLLRVEIRWADGGLRRKRVKVSPRIVYQNQIARSERVARNSAGRSAHKVRRSRDRPQSRRAGEKVIE